MSPDAARCAPTHVTSTTKSPGSSTWAASSVDCGVATLTPARRTPSELQLVAVEEGLLAADAAQHPQPRGGVGAERRQLADLLALLALALLQRPDHDAERERQHRHAEQDEQPELRRGGEQDDRDDDVRDDAAGEPRQDVEGAAGPQRVVRHDRDDLARRQLAAHRVARVRHVMAHDLGEPEGRLQPVLHRVAMPHHARSGLDDAEHGEQDAEPGQRIVVAVDDSLLDRLPDRVRHQRLRDHPDDPERDRDRERPLLVPADPEEQPEGRAGVRSPRIGDREIDHGCASTAGLPTAAPPPRVPEKRPTRFGVTAGRVACTRCGVARVPRGHASR